VLKLRPLFIVNVIGAIRDDGERPAAVDEYTLSNVIDVCSNPGLVPSGLRLWLVALHHGQVKPRWSRSFDTLRSQLYCPFRAASHCFAK